MRDIKFRIFDKDANELTYLYSFYWFEEHGVENSDGKGHYADYILMQYTGLRDKNGKEIYEGDIINNSVVYWSDQWAMFSVKGEGIGALIRFADDYEIQGNIYENPELVRK